MLREVKNTIRHYFEDELGRKQGEYKSWWTSGKNHVHCYYVNGTKHGEYKDWYINGELWEHCFYNNGTKHGEFITYNENKKILKHGFYVNGEYKKFKEMPFPKTLKARMLFLLKYDIPLLPVN